MTLNKTLSACFSGFGILALVLDAQTALNGAAAGMELCIKTVVPSLFPFLFLCGLLTDSLWGSELRILKSAGNRLGIPSGGESLLLAALLGGYPAGAAAVADAYRQGNLSKKDAEHLLTFCSNAGPAFLFGMTARQFPQKHWVLAVWAILILSSFLTGRIFSDNSEENARLSSNGFSVSGHLNRTVKTMGYICGWVVLFRILSEFLNRWILWYFPAEVQIFVTGLLELSNGCCSLSGLEDLRLRFLVCTLIHAFGGLCVTMQTASVIGGLSMRSYLLGKLLQSGLSLVFCFLYLGFGWPGLAAAAVIAFIFPGKAKKAVDFQGVCVYNSDITTGRTLYAVSKKD